MRMFSDYEAILHRVRAVKRRALAMQATAGLLRALAAWCCTVVAAVGVESVFHFNPLGRTIILAVAALAVAGEFAYLALPHLLRLAGALAQPNDDEVARVIGDKFPAVRDTLVNGMQLARELSEKPDTRYSATLIETSFAELSRKVQNTDFTAAVEPRDRNRATRAFFAAALLPLASFTMFSPFQSAGYRLIHFSESFAAPAPFTFAIEPGNAEQLKGDSLVVTIRTIGYAPPREITVNERESDEQIFHPAVLQSSNGVFQYTFHGLKRTVDYYAEASAIESEHYRVTVNDRPEIRSLKVALVFPSYTRAQPVEQDENNGDVVGLTGTEAHVTIATNKPIVSAALLFTPVEQVGNIDTSDASGTTAVRAPAKHEHPNAEKKYFPLHADGNAVQGYFTVRESGTYHIELTDNDSIRSTDPIEYHVMALPDEYPSIQVLEPLPVTDVTDATKIGVIARIHDDYGFTKLVLRYRLAKSNFTSPWKEFKELSIPIETRATDQDAPYIWDISELSLVPEDQVEYYLEVYDNDVVSGPKSAKSAMLTLRLPSLDAVLKESDETQADANQDLQQATKQADELHKEIEQTMRELRQQAAQKNLSWQQQKKMQEILNKQNAIQQKIDDARQKLDEAMQKLESHEALSPETLQKYMELQKLFQDLKSPELMDAMKKMQQAMQQMSPEQMREAMKNFTFNEDEFRKSIERTEQLLKHIQAQQKTDQLIKQAEQLQKEQQQLQDQTQNAQNQQQKEQLSQSQQELQKQAEDLQKAAEDLQKEMKELGKDAPQKEMQQAEKSLDSAQTPQQMQNASQQIEQSQMSEAQQSQQNAKQGLQQFQQNMQSVQNAMKQHEQREATNEMRRSLQDMIDLSKREESLQEQTNSSQSNSAQLPELAKEQADALNDMNGVVNRMMKLSQKSFAVTPEMGRELGKAMRDMQSATSSLEQRQAPQSGQEEGSAMGDMNSAAMMMQQSLQKMAQGNNPGSGSPGGDGMQSFMQQLGQMAGEQEGINGQTQKMGNMNPGSLSMEQQAQMGRIAGQQAAVQQSLQKLQEKQDEMTGGKKNTLGDLNKIADEMQEVVKDMQNNNVNPETIRKQERILSRLLDASRSQHERDFDKNREGKTGQDVVRNSPDALPSALTQPKTSQDDVLRLLEQSYTKDYEERIKKYFEALQKANTQ